MAKRLLENLQHALKYAIFRPCPPQELIREIIQKTNGNQLALDIGCGTGQCTRLLAPYFDKVIGIDVSESQIEAANHKIEQILNLEYRVGPSEVLDFVQDNSVDLITCSQSLHWFDIPEFYKEAERVLRSQGVLAVFGYYPTEPSPESILTPYQVKALNDLRNYMYEEVVGKYWAPEIRLSYDFGYKTIIPLPFPNVERFDEFYIETEDTIEDFAGYIKTWSAFQTFQTAEGVEKAEEVIENFIKSAKQIYPGGDKLLLRTRFFMLIGVKP